MGKYIQAFPAPLSDIGKRTFLATKKGDHVRIFLLMMCLIPMVGLGQDSCPENAFQIGNRCVCSFGYVTTNQGCEKVDLQCNYGFRKVENSCVKIDLPENASINPMSEEGWKCDLGFRKVNGSCMKIDLPENASISLMSEEGWACDLGFEKIDDACVVMSTGELIKSLNTLNYIMLNMAMPNSGRSCSSGFDACEDECDNQFYSLTDENRCLEACKKGKQACE